jgi:hypothetical protein
MPANGPTGPDAAASLAARSAALHREMIDQYERFLAAGNHWALYAFLGVEHLGTCTGSYYLQSVLGVQSPWPYFFLWLGQTAVAVTAVTVADARAGVAKSPLSRYVVGTWTAFLLLCWGVAALNVLAGHPVFLFLPMLATLSSFAFLVLSSFLSRRFVIAALVMCATGGLIAHFPAYGFLLYGAGWLLVLEGLAIIFLRKRRRWLPAPRPEAAAGPAPNGTAARQPALSGGRTA